MTLAALRMELMSAAVGDDRKGWVHLIPAGTFAGIDGRGPYRANNPAAIIEATKRRFGKRQIVIDYEHQAVHARRNGKPAPAAGWIVGLEARDDGVWGRVEWTGKAAAHIAAREYRYLSPVFFHDETGRLMSLHSAALTNTPNLDQLAALASAEGATMDPETLQRAAELLGLPPDTDEETVAAEMERVAGLAASLEKLTGGDGEKTPVLNATRPDPAKYVPIGEFERAVSEMNRLRQGVAQDAAERHVAEHIRSGHIAPFLKDWAVELCTTNLPAFDAFVEKVGPSFKAIVTPVDFTAARRAVDRERNEKLGAPELAVCSAMGLTAEEFEKARGAETNEGEL